MRKALSLTIILTLLIAIIPSYIFADGSETNQLSIQLPVKESDETKSEVTYTIEVPKYIAEIKLSSLKVESGMQIVANSVKFDKTTHKLTLTVKGKLTKGQPLNVVGLGSSDGRLFTANPYNAVCRFSDGKKWQINTYNQTTYKETRDEYVNNYQNVTKTDPPTKIMREVMSFSSRTLNVSSTYFFADYTLDKNGKPSIKGTSINRNLVDPTSLKVEKNAVFTMDTTDKAKRIVFPSGYDPKSPTIGVAYNMSSSSEYLDTMYGNPIKPSDPKFLTGHAGCWKYLVNYQYYITATTIPQDTYKYWGNVSFEYITYKEATLVGTLTADPSSVLYKDNDVVVDLILEGEVINIEDPNAISHYNLYVRLEDGTMISTTSDVNIPANGKATIKRTFKYTISKSRLSSSSVTELTEKFVGRIKAEYKPSSYYTGELNSGELYASTYVYKQMPIQTPPPPDTKKQPPVAVINGQSEVKLGDLTTFDGYESYDTDGTIESYRWRLPGAKDVTIKQDTYDPTYSDVTVWYDTLGAQKVLLYVKDNDGLQHGTYHSFVVVEPTVEAAIQQSGTLKENRKVTFTEVSDSPSQYPVIPEKTTWKIESMYGDIPASQIKYSGSLKGRKEIDVLFKQAGEYLITLTVENTAGYKDTVQRSVVIKPDEVPVVDFTFQQKIYRDPANNNVATFELYDRSYTVDADPIVSRKWYVVYDANNDGIFNEAKVLFNTGNNTEVKYETKKVGKYAFYLEVQEEFGQPTIEQFVTADDRRKGRTW